MEKNTRSLSEFRAQDSPKLLRASLLTLLAVAVIAAAVPNRTRIEASSQPNYTVLSLGAGANPSAAKIGDLDADGKNDIAVVNRQGDLQLYFNNGDGSFTRLSSGGLWPSSSNTLDLDIGDLNGDGLNDLAVAFATQTGAMSVLLNQGNRSFSAPANYNSCSFSNGIAIGDLDRDGDKDLADISQCNSSGVLLNNGAGGFAFGGTFGSGGGSRSIAVADLNGDGAKDIAYLNDASVTVLMNNGTATFSSPMLYWVWEMPNDLAVGDFDGDGDADIATVNSYYSLVFVLINGGNGDMISYSECPGGNAPTAIAVGDFNGDGRPLDYAALSWGTNSLSVFLNQGYYLYNDPITVSVGQGPVDVAAGSLDGDSLPDLVAVNQGSGTISILFSGLAVPPPPPPPPAQITLTVTSRKSRTARLVDLNWTGAPGSQVDVYRNGTFRARVPNSGSYTEQFPRNSNGNYTYKVCVPNQQVCSNEARIRF